MLLQNLYVPLNINDAFVDVTLTCLSLKPAESYKQVFCERSTAFRVFCCPLLMLTLKVNDSTEV